MSFVIEPASPADLPRVLALLEDCRLFTRGVPEAFATFVVARASGRLAGCAGLEPYGPLGLLRSVAVLSDERRGGVGRALTASVEQLARELGLRELYLLTQTAAPFFARLGYEPVSRSAVPSGIAESWEFREGCPLSAAPMRRLL